MVDLPPRPSCLEQATIHRQPTRIVCCRVQRPALHQPSSLVQRGPGWGGDLSDPAHPVGSAGTAAQRSPYSIEPAGLGRLDSCADDDVFD